MIKDSLEGQTQSGKLKEIVCTCGCVNGFTEAALNKIHQVDLHIRTCPDENCMEHGYINDLECAHCHAFLCRIVLLKEEFLK